MFTRALRSFRERNPGGARSSSRFQGYRTPGSAPSQRFAGAKPRLAAIEDAPGAPVDDVITFDDLGLTQEDWEDPRLAVLGEDERNAFFEFFAVDYEDEANTAGEEQDF